jgi:hypothetical protein
MLVAMIFLLFAVTLAITVIKQPRKPKFDGSDPEQLKTMKVALEV